MSIIFALIFVLAPAGVLWLCKKYSWIGKIGPILILYLLGLILGNLGLIPGLPEFVSRPEGLPTVQDILSSAMVPVAIPLLLFGCSFRKSETRAQLLALLTGLVAVVTAVVAGYLIFGKGIGEGAAKIGGMLTGVYTGGTVNLAALKAMLDVPEETYVLLNSYDMVISFLFLMFLVAIGIKLFRKFLPGEAGRKKKRKKEPFIPVETPEKPALWSREWWKEAGILIGVTAAIVGISAGIAALVPDGWFMTVLILLLTTLGIATSFNKKIQKMGIAEDIGMYCIYIFSIVVASMADFSKMDLAGSLNILGYLSLVIFGSLALQIIFAKIFHIDADTMVIASTAFICSPPFVPMMAAAMKNRKVLLAGLSIGIIGYAVGTYLGFLISRLLPLIG